MIGDEIADDADREKTIDEVRHAMEDIPGVVSSTEQPLAHLISHMISGVKAQIGIKLYGDDLDVLRNTAEEMKQRIAGVEGVSVDMYDDFRNEHQLLERLNQFSAHAHAEGLKASVSGIRTLSLHTLAVSSGADFVGGYPVSNATRTIGGRKTFDLSALYNAAAHAA